MVLWVGEILSMSLPSTLFFSDENLEDGRGINFMLASSEVVMALASPTLITQEMEVAALNMEEAQNFIKTYKASYNRNSSDA